MRGARELAQDFADVEDQHHRPVAENGGAADQFAGDDGLVQRLDHQFFLAHQFVHHQSELALAAADHDDEDAPVSMAAGRRRQPVQADQREHLVAELQHLVAVHAVNVGLAGACDLQHRFERDGIQALGDAEEHGADNGQRQRQAQLEGGAAAGMGLDGDAALQLLQGGFHHVHADAASGDFADLLGGAEAGLENEFQGVGLAHPRRLFGRRQPARHSPGQHGGGVHSATVVADLDHHLVTLVEGMQADCALVGFAGGASRRRGFDAVIHGIADQVNQRFGKRVEQALVEIGFLAADLEGDVLSAELRDIAHQARETAEQLVDRHHADFHRRALQRVQHLRLEGQGVGELGAQRIFRATST